MLAIWNIAYVLTAAVYNCISRDEVWIWIWKFRSLQNGDVTHHCSLIGLVCFRSLEWINTSNRWEGSLMSRRPHQGFVSCSKRSRTWEKWTGCPDDKTTLRRLLIRSTKKLQMRQRRRSCVNNSQNNYRKGKEVCWQNTEVSIWYRSCTHLTFYFSAMGGRDSPRPVVPQSDECWTTVGRVPRNVSVDPKKFQNIKVQ